VSPLYSVFSNYYNIRLTLVFSTLLGVLGKPQFKETKFYISIEMLLRINIIHLSYNVLDKKCFCCCDKGIAKQFQQPTKCGGMRRGRGGLAEWNPNRPNRAVSSYRLLCDRLHFRHFLFNVHTPVF